MKKMNKRLDTFSSSSSSSSSSYQGHFSPSSSYFVFLKRGRRGGDLIYIYIYIYWVVKLDEVFYRRKGRRRRRKIGKEKIKG